MRALLGLPFLVAALILVPGASSLVAGGTPHSVDFTIEGTAGASGWYTSDVVLHWSVTPIQGLVGTTGCLLAIPVAGDTSGTPLTCTATWSDGDEIVRTKVIKIDKTPPTATAATPDRPADANGWYNHGFSVTFGGTDAMSGIASCTSAAYAGPDTPGAPLVGTCSDQAGNASGSLSLSFKYDATAPEIGGASPDRPPDANGWYNHPVTVAFAGSDALSGIGACSSATYGGPNGDPVSLTGVCRDRAGNASAPRSVALKYDGTAPKPPSAVEAAAGDGIVNLSWRPSPDAQLVVITRSRGLQGGSDATVYRGTGKSFTDKEVANGVRYRYVVSSVDVAGNAAGAIVTATPKALLSSPKAGARVTAPPLLAWARVPRATYYNVQLFRGRTKVLSTWPSRPRLKLRRAWVYEGREHRLTPGRYRWYVWPATGPRTARKYGKLLGQSSFVVVR